MLDFARIQNFSLLESVGIIVEKFSKRDTI
jgi:hypothetical protein